MTCANCGASAARVRIVRGRERCAACGGFSESGGTLSDGVLSRQRTRDQGVKFEGDILNPWAYDKASRSFVPNDQFLKRHADNAMNFYAKDDLAAYPKLKERLHERLEGDADARHLDGKVEWTGEYEPAIQEAITNA